MLRRGLCRVVSSSIAIPRRQLPPRALASRVYSVNMSPTPPSSPPSKRVKVNGADANGESSSASSSALQQYPIPPRDAGFTKRTKNRKKAREAALAKTGEEPIWFDIVQLLGPEKVQQVKDAEGKGDGEWVDRFSRDTILVGKVEKLSAHGACNVGIARAGRRADRLKIHRITQEPDSSSHPRATGSSPSPPSSLVRQSKYE